MYRLLITYHNSFAGGGAVATTTLVPFESKEEADTVHDQYSLKLSFTILKMYSEDA